MFLHRYPEVVWVGRVIGGQSGARSIGHYELVHMRRHWNRSYELRSIEAGEVLLRLAAGHLRTTEVPSYVTPTTL